jgi:antitoxin (DNA-binding transcriptional repressor) of toxin-antitoxin stability system
VITNRGKPVAMLVPTEAEDRPDTARIGREMLEYRDQVKRALGGTPFRDIAHEGHRYYTSHRAE